MANTGRGNGGGGAEVNLSRYGESSEDPGRKDSSLMCNTTLDQLCGPPLPKGEARGAPKVLQRASSGKMEAQGVVSLYTASAVVGSDYLIAGDG